MIKFEWVVVSSPEAADQSTKRQEYACMSNGIWCGWTTPGHLTGRASFPSATAAMHLVRQIQARSIYKEAIPVKRFFKARTK